MKLFVLSSRFHILWLTLCQPHNSIEIEVSGFVWQKSANWLIAIHYYVAEQYDQCHNNKTELNSLFSTCLFTVHRTRRKKTPHCSPATSESSWPSKCPMINARLLWMFLTQNFFSVLVGRWTCRSKTCPLMTLRSAYRAALWAYMIITAS